MFVGLTTLAGTKPATVADSTVEVTIDKFTFAPATITVEAGTTVKLLNQDDIPHTVVARSLVSDQRHSIPTIASRISSTTLERSTTSAHCIRV
jgi:plastocyanin